MPRPHAAARRSVRFDRRYVGLLRAKAPAPPTPQLRPPPQFRPAKAGLHRARASQGVRLRRANALRNPLLSSAICTTCADAQHTNPRRLTACAASKKAKLFSSAPVQSAKCTRTRNLVIGMLSAGCSAPNFNRRYIQIPNRRYVGCVAFVHETPTHPPAKKLYSSALCWVLRATGPSSANAPATPPAPVPAS